MTQPPHDLAEGHTVRSYDAELERLSTLFLEMGGLVIDQVGLAVEALRNGEIEAAKTVIEREERVNDYDLEAEELILSLLAKRQPMGGDLRAIISLGRGVMDLERAGDEAKKIAKTARKTIRNEVQIDAELLQCAGSMAELAAAESRALNHSMTKSDAVEGGAAYFERRTPNWSGSVNLDWPHWMPGAAGRTGQN